MLNKKNLIYLLLILISALIYTISFPSDNTLAGAIVGRPNIQQELSQNYASSTCGNGVLDPGETCDPGNPGAWGQNLGQCFKLSSSSIISWKNVLK